MDFVLSGAAACGACLFTNPLEVVKTRMQLQGELKSRGTYQVYYRNVFHAFYTIGKVDGLAGLQKGLVPGLFYQFFMNGVRLGSYAIIESSGYIHTNGRVSAVKTTVAGAVAGVVGAVMGSPIYLVKTHLQSQSTSSIAVGHQYKHQGMIHALAAIYREHGVLGLWRGSSAAVPRVSVGSAAQLSTFSSSKELVIDLQVFPKNSWLVALSAGMISSVVVVLAMTPFDVVSTRLYNQPVDHLGKVLIPALYIHLTGEEDGCCGNRFGMLFSIVFAAVGVAGALYSFTVAVTGLTNGPLCFDGTEWTRPFLNSTSPYMNDYKSWADCREPKNVVQFNIGLFVTLLAASGVQGLLCAIQMINGLFGCLCGTCFSKQQP